MSNLVKFFEVVFPKLHSCCPFRAKSLQNIDRRVIPTLRSADLRSLYTLTNRGQHLAGDGHTLFPILHDYSEDRFGPDFMPTEADYSDEAIWIARP